MLNTFEVYVLLFFSYAILGWCLEVLEKFRQYHRFINRGFLIGPYCPVYGCGGLLITLLLEKYIEDPFALFVFAILICSILEYLTSYVMEKVFHARWWDYSTKRFNLNGRVCLDFLFFFGLLGVLIMYVLNPFFFRIYRMIPMPALTSICSILLLLFIADSIVSLIILFRFRKDIQLFDKDNTEELSAYVWKELLATMTWGERRLARAFPNLRLMRIAIKKNIRQAKNELNQKQEKIKRQTEQKIMELKEEYNYRMSEIQKLADKKIDLLNLKKK